jgi:3-methylfumaryl-CoA hydratase
MNAAAELAQHVAGWAPAPVEVRGRIDRWPGEAFAALLDQPTPFTEPDAPLPPLWHGFHLLDHPAQAELGDDGHPARGRFLPPLPHRRRMFAGGRLEVRAPLRPGEEVRRRSSLGSVTPRAGRSGAMVFVTVRHELRREADPDAGAAVVEEQDFAYRSQPPGTARGLPAEQPAAAEPAPAGVWRATLQPDAAMLFRFSALTYNTHRIHYDHPYVTGVEGYPGLVVHGPLLALLLLELPRRFAPDRVVASFAYRLHRPAFAGAPIVATGGPDGELRAGVAGRAPAVTGTVRLR